MKRRTRYIIVGTLNNGMKGSLTVYASNKERAEDYAEQHFKGKYKIR